MGSLYNLMKPYSEFRSKEEFNTYQKQVLKHYQFQLNKTDAIIIHFLGKYAVNEKQKTVGVACRYDGNDNLVSKIEDLLQQEDTVLICPEVLGGLPTPRPSAEIIGGNGDDVLDGKAKVMTKDGEDVTESFVSGAYKALEQIKNLQPEYIILKERSPSCGSSTIYTGEFNGNKQTGYGVTTALFKRHGLKVISEEDFENIKRN